MANSLREVCKRNKEAKAIVMSIKEEGLPSVYSRLKENGLSIRGLTKDLMERLARFEIMRQIPNTGIEWDDAVDLNSDQELDSGKEEQNDTIQPAHTGQEAEAAGMQDQAATLVVNDEQRRVNNGTLEPNPFALRPPPRRPKNGQNTPTRNGRLYLAEEIHMLNQREAHGDFRHFQRFSRAGLFYSRPTGTITKTSTAIDPRPISRTVNRERLQNIPNLGFLQPGGNASEYV